MRLAALLLVSSFAGPVAFARDGGPGPAASESPGAISGGTVKAWMPDLGRLTISLGKKQEIVLSTAGAVVQGALAVGRVVDVTYVGERATIVTVRP